MKRSLVIISLFTVGLAAVALVVGGWSRVLEGLEVSAATALRSVFMIFLSCVIMGQIQVLLSKDVLDRWLQRFGGMKGILIGALAGGLFPGGPYIYYPFALGFTGKGLPFYIFFAFILGKNLYDFSRIPMEVAMLGSRVALVRNLVTFPIPIMAGLLSQRIFASRTLESIFLQTGERDGADQHNS